jgi:hypothetical protein
MHYGVGAELRERVGTCHLADHGSRVHGLGIEAVQPCQPWREVARPRKRGQHLIVLTPRRANIVGKRAVRLGQYLIHILGVRPLHVKK